MGGRQMVDDPRTESQQLRRTDLMKIAKSHGIKLTGHPTSAQLLALLDANSIEASFRVLEETAAQKEATKPTRVDHAAELEAFKQTLADSPWFTLKSLAEEYGVELPPKGEGRADILREAILKAAQNG